MSSLKKRIITALCIGSIALLIRIIIIQYYPVEALAGGDGAAFWSFAEGIINGKGFTSTIEPWLADRPPFYPYFLSFIFLVSRKSYADVYYAQSLITAISCASFFLAANKLFGYIRGIFAGIICAVLPFFLIFTKQILTEAIYPALLIFLICILILYEKNTICKFILIGLMLGVITLTRREAVLPAALIISGFMFILGKISFRQKAINFGIAIAIAGITVSPWIIRNWVVFGKPLMSSSAGVNFMVGNNPASDGSYAQPPAEWGRQLIGLGELERDKVAWNLSSSWIKENPARFFSRIPQKLKYLWGPTNSLFLDAFDLLLIPFYFFGFFYLFKKHRSWKELLIIFVPLAVCVTLIGMVYVGWWRYRESAYVGLILLATFGLPDFLVRWVEKLFPFVKNEQLA